MPRILALFLSIALGLPNPAFALRVENGGLEEQTPTTRSIAKALGYPVPVLSTTGLEERFKAFQTVAEQRLREVGLFSEPEIVEILERLGKLHEAMSRWPFRLTAGGERGIHSEEQWDNGTSLIIAAPVLLGIKPRVEFDFRSQNRREAESAKEWILKMREAGLLNLFSVINQEDTAVSEPGMEGYILTKITMTVFDLDQIHKAVASEKNPEIRAEAELLERGLIDAIGRGNDKEIMTMREMRHKELAKGLGALFGYPGSAVKEYAAYGKLRGIQIFFLSRLLGFRAYSEPSPIYRWTTKLFGLSRYRSFSSRWSNGSITLIGSQNSPEIPRTLNRFDAAAELLADYLRVVRDASIDLQNLRALEMKTQGRPQERVFEEIAMPPAAGLEESVQEQMDGFRSAIETPRVVVLGKSLADRFLGLQVLAGFEEHVVIERGAPVETAIHLAERGVTHVQYFGGLEEAQRFEAAANPLQIKATTHTPKDPRFRSLLEEILSNLGIPVERITAGLEEFAHDLEELAVEA